MLSLVLKKNLLRLLAIKLKNNYFWRWNNQNTWMVFVAQVLEINSTYNLSSEF